MADQRIVTVDGKTQAFPADATDAEISAVLNAIPASNAKEVPKAKTWTDVAVNALPTAGAVLGGMIGGAGGTVAGFGVGGVPGAAGGAGLGGAAGEAAKQLINRARGAETPQSASEAALAIGKEGAIDAATTGAVGAAGQAMRPVAGRVLQMAGKQLESPATLTQLAGKAISATGRAIDATPAAAAPKIALDATDVTRIKQLIAAGMPQGEATAKVWNLKVQNIMKGWAP